MVATVLASPAETVAEHAFALRVEDGGLTGPGADWLWASAGDAQFVVFGEQRDVPEIAQVVAATYRRLAPEGFRYLVLETGPWIGHRLARDPIGQVTRRHPFSITWGTDADLAVLDAVGADSDVDLIWGIDTPVTAIHPLDRLRELAPNADGARLARLRMLDALVAQGAYLRTDHFADLDELAAAFEGAPEEAWVILDSLRAGMEISIKQRRGESGELSRYAAAQQRGQFMRNAFMRQYRLAGSGGAAPRAIVRLGAEHVREGHGADMVLTFGNFLDELATAHGMRALNIGIRAVRARGAPEPYAAAMRDVTGTGAGLLIDCAGLRSAGLLGDVPDDVLEELHRHDALILLVDTTKATRDRIGAARSLALVRLLSASGKVRLVAGAILVVALGLATWGLCRYWRQRAYRKALEAVQEEMR